MHSLSVRFHRLGLWLFRHRWAVIATWTLALAIGLWGAQWAPQVLKGSAAGVAGSGSARAEQLLTEKFRNPYQFNFIVTLTSEMHSLDDGGLAPVLQALEETAAKQTYVTRTFSYQDRPEASLRSPDGHRTFFVVGLDAASNLAAEQRVAPLREALAPVTERLRAADPSLKVFVTGQVPLNVDGTQVLARDTTEAEHRILPIAVLFLLLAFGALAAAGIPVLAGATATVITLGLLVLFGLFFNISSMAQSISSMVGLGIGIDYSLIIVSRFREALGRGIGVEEAVAETSATAGQAVLYSGLTVMIGFLALFLPNLIEINAMALAGSLTVLVSVALATTLLPALLAVLGRWVDWPFGLSRFIGRFDVSALWATWARLVMRFRWPFLVAGTALLLALAAPILGVQFGQFGSKFFPTSMDSALGVIELEGMQQAGRLYPISLVVERKDEGRVISPKSLKALAGVVKELKADPTVTEVHSIVENASRLIMLNNLFFGGDVSALRKRFPEAASLLISEDGRGTVVQIFPRSDADYKEIKDLARRLQARDWSQVPGMDKFEVVVGGFAAQNNDFEHAIFSALPKVIALVFGITFALLYLSFRSVVLPLKALAMNTLSVAASFGALVLVFQHGVGAGLIGLPGAPGVVMVLLPIIIFGAVFGLSMDYEVFLLSRIQEEYQRTGRNRESVALGLGATGGIITNAALIMLLVFGAFAYAEVIFTKMLGFGLAVAVLVDALIIRVMLVPSFMAIVGRWNWWPNIVPPRDGARAVAASDVPGVAETPLAK